MRVGNVKKKTLKKGKKKKDGGSNGTSDVIA
jgi:hypothetical protein